MKVVPESYKGYRFTLGVIDEVNNFMVTSPIYQSRLEEIENALIEHVFSKHSIPKCMIIDQDNAFMSTLIAYLFMKIGIKNSCSL